MGNLELVQELRRKGIRDEGVLEAMLKTPREDFLEYKKEAYIDVPLPIGSDQTISQPYVVALMTSALGPKKEHKVLEIGTGSGYQAAILSHMVSEVYSVERIRSLHESAKRNIEEMGIGNVHRRYGDGFEGWKEHSPYDSIILTAAPYEFPKKLLDQLKDGGRIVAPIGPAGDQELNLYMKEGGEVKKEKLVDVRFVPMVGYLS